MMKTLIIEDETAAALNLKRMLAAADPQVEVLAVLDTVVDSVEWFRNNEQPDLVFMDIHLADGQAFNIFERVEVTAPIVFATAYDRYALDAFKVNSIDYLLKPIKTADLQRALDKFKRLTQSERREYSRRVNEALSSSAQTMQAFLIPQRDKLIPLEIEKIAYCYTSSEKVVAVTYEGTTLPLDRSLDQLCAVLPAHDFFRANRQFIVARSAIVDISVWFGSRVMLNLNVATPERIVVSKVRTPEFKRWFTQLSASK